MKYNRPLLGVAISAVLLIDCGPRVHAVVNPTAHLNQCGVVGVGIGSSKQAKCVAGLWGLARGARPWRVRQKEEARTGVQAWEVCNTLWIPTDTREAGGLCLSIGQIDGDLVGWHYWEHSVVY